MKVGVGLGAYLEVAQTLRHFSSGMRDIKDRKWKIEDVCRKGKENAPSNQSWHLHAQK